MGRRLRTKDRFRRSGSPVQSATADRTEFLGEHGSVFTPAGLKNAKLFGRGSGVLPGWETNAEAEFRRESSALHDGILLSRCLCQQHSLRDLRDWSHSKK